jgi:hypothetical protein
MKVGVLVILAAMVPAETTASSRRDARALAGSMNSGRDLSGVARRDVVERKVVASRGVGVVLGAGRYRSATRDARSHMMHDFPKFNLRI